MKESKPDNSDEQCKCNIVVKCLDAEMSDEELERYFLNYGPIRSCKIAKDPVSGESKLYGFVWFKEARDANKAMLDFRNNYQNDNGRFRHNDVEKIHFQLDWYKIIAQRPSAKSDS